MVLSKIVLLFKWFIFDNKFVEIILVFFYFLKVWVGFVEFLKVFYCFYGCSLFVKSLWYKMDRVEDGMFSLLKFLRRE